MRQQEKSMTMAGDADTTLTRLMDDIAALKRDVTGLLSHLRSGVSDGTQSAGEYLDESTRRLYRGAAKEGERTAKMIGEEVRKQPLAAVLIVLAAGYLAGRLLSR
jgi:ElaB/YqjD/DUF883 family membrane-anchored ribosome-binding protein